MNDSIKCDTCGREHYGLKELSGVPGDKEEILCLECGEYFTIEMNEEGYWVIPELEEYLFD